MMPPESAPLPGLLALVSLLLAAGRFAALPADLRLLERLLIACLAAWGSALAATLLIGAVPGGLRPWPLALGALAIAFGVSRLGPAPQAPDWPRRFLTAISARPRPERILAIGIVLSSGMLALQLVRLPPTGVDSLGYHLLGPVAWVQQGQIHRIDTYWAWANSYPQNVEALSALAMVFTANLRSADLPNLLFLLLYFTGLATLARQGGAHPFAIALCCLAVFLSPFLLAYASATYCDIPVAACYLAATALLLAAHRTGTAAPGWWALIALALAAGSKPSALPGLVLMAGFAAWLWRDSIATMWRRPAGRRAIAPALGVLLALAGWWYLRSWIWYGNPFYPWTIALGPFTLFEGPAGHYAAHIESIDGLYVGSRQPWLLGLQRYFGHFGGDLRVQLMWAREWFGPQVSIAGTIALLWWGWRSIRDRDQTGLAVIGLGVALTLLNPVPMVPRFVAHWPAFTAVALSLMLTSAGQVLRTVAQTILTLSLALTLLLLPWSLVPIDEAAMIPDRFYAYSGAAYWWTGQLLRPGDTVVYVQPLRATGRAIPNDLSAQVRYLAPDQFTAKSALSPGGTTWLLLADEERVAALSKGQSRDAVLADLQRRAPFLDFRLMASGSTFTLRNYRLYALRPQPVSPTGGRP